MKKLKIVLLGLLTASLAGALAACTGGGDTYTFTFDTRGGSAIEALELHEGDAVSRPADPTKSLFTFDDWYADAALSEPYTFGAMPAQDVTVYAGWTPQVNVLIEYDSMGGSAVASTVGLAGSTFNKQVETPTREGYVFDGWYTDADCTQRFAFTAFPTQNITLYAGWTPDANYAFITYYGNGRLLADPVPVVRGSTFEDPGFFGEDIVTAGWFTDSDRMSAYQGGTVNSDITLYTTYYTQGLTFSSGGVASYAGTSQQVIVPDVYNSTPVIYVGEGAFRDTSVTAVTLPDSVTQIGSYAFYNCRWLASINLTQNVRSIGEYAFANAVRLQSCGDLSSVTAIPEGCFLGCAQLDAVTLSANTRTVGALAFADCSSLTEIVLPGSVTSIGAQAFEDCSALTSLTLSASLTSFGEGALAGCTSLASVTVPEGSTRLTLEDGNLYIGAQLIRYFAGDKEETSFTLPAGKTSVGANAFENASALTSLVFPAGTTLSRNALVGVTALESLTLPTLNFGEDDYLAALFGAPAQETAGSRSFFIPSTLSTVTFNGSVTELAPYAFYGATGLTAVEGLGELTSIGDGAFAYTGISSYEIPATVRSFGARVFEGCDIAAYAVEEGNDFYRTYDGCLYSTVGSLIAVPVGKETISFPDDMTVRSIGRYAFYGSAIETLVVPESVTSIGFAAFARMSALTSLVTPVIGDGGDNAYMGYVFGSYMSIDTPSTGGYSSLIVSTTGNLPRNLTTLTVTGTYTEIPDMAFARLENVTSITVGEGENITSFGAFSYYFTSVTQQSFAGTVSVGESAFRGTDLTSVDLSVANITDGAGLACFAELGSLAYIDLGSTLTAIPNAMFYNGAASEYSDEDGYSYSVRRSAVDQTITIPATVASIGSEAFSGVGVAELWEPASPEQQPDAYLHGTRNENFAIVFAEGCAVTEIRFSAFAFSGITSMAIPSTVTTLGQTAFETCIFLESVTFGTEEDGSALTRVDALAFENCTALASVTLWCGQVPAMALSSDGEEAAEGATAFEGANENVIVYVRAALVDAFRAAEGWSALGENIRAAGTQTAGGNQ